MFTHWKIYLNKVLQSNENDESIFLMKENLN